MNPYSDLPFYDGEPEPVVLRRGIAARSCNLHDNCDRAASDYRRAYLERYGQAAVTGAHHCHSDDCEDCYGC